MQDGEFEGRNATEKLLVVALTSLGVNVSKLIQLLATGSESRNRPLGWEKWLEFGVLEVSVGPFPLNLKLSQGNVWNGDQRSFGTMWDRLAVVQLRNGEFLTDCPRGEDVDRPQYPKVKKKAKLTIGEYLASKGFAPSDILAIAEYDYQNYGSRGDVKELTFHCSSLLEPVYRAVEEHLRKPANLATLLTVAGMFKVPLVRAAKTS